MIQNYITFNLLKKLKFLALIAFLSISCSKNESGNALHTDQAYLDIEVGGYVAPSILETTEGILEPNKIQRKMQTSSSEEELFTKAILQENTQEHQTAHQKRASVVAPFVIPPAHKLTKMLPNTKYVVLVFDDENHLVGSPVLSTVGEKTRLTIPSAYRSSVVNYTVVAFSYNSDQDSDYSSFLSGTIGNNPQILIPTDREFFYSHSIVPMDFTLANPDAGGYQGSIQLLFEAQTAKVGVVLDAMGSNAKVTASKGMITSDDLLNKVKVNTGKLNLRLKSITEIVSQEVDGSFDLESTDANGADSLAHHVYTVVNPASPVINKFKVSFNSITVKRSDGISSSVNDKIYNFNDITALEKGKKVNARMYLFEGFAVGNVLWSNTNLYYDASANRKYRFRELAFDGRTLLATDYWAFKRMNPNNLSTATENIGDPCSQVYPSGWRLPRESDMDALTAQTATFHHHNSIVDYTQYTSGTHSLTFATNGYYSAPDSFIGSATGGNLGVYWIDSDYNNTVGNNRNMLVFTTWGVSYVNGRNDFSWYAPNYSFANVRCVRDAR